MAEKSLPLRPMNPSATMQKAITTAIPPLGNTSEMTRFVIVKTRKAAAAANAMSERACGSASSCMAANGGIMQTRSTRNSRSFAASCMSSASLGRRWQRRLFWFCLDRKPGERQNRPQLFALLGEGNERCLQFFDQRFGLLGGAGRKAGDKLDVFFKFLHSLEQPV